MLEINKRLLSIIVALSLIVGSVATFGIIEIFDLQSDDIEVTEDNQEKNEKDSNQDTSANDEQQNSDRNLDILNYTMMLIQENYVYDVSEEELIEGAIEGIVNKLGDPYSEYMDPETTEQFNQQLESSFDGIGAEVTKIGEYITIIAPLKDSPAERAGIRPNDRVLAVDGMDLDGFTVIEAVNHIRGEKGTEVTLTIDRDGTDEPFDVVIVRDTIPVTTVYPEVFSTDEGKIGLLEIRSFAEGTAAEFEEEIKRLEDEENIDGLIIDVRGNPGGLFNAVEDILKHFFEDEEPFVQMARRDEDPLVEYIQGYGEKPYPVAVLVNEGSASASEILAAAMKEVGGYEIIGTGTFGKGTVQQTMALGDGLLKVTIFHWLSPLGNEINEVGVEPTIYVEQPDFYYTSLIVTDEPLELNMNSAEVEKMQIMLDAIGYDPGRQDGYFDEATEQALIEFQQDQDLNDTGVLDEESKLILEELVIEAVGDYDSDLQLQKALDVLLAE